MQGSIVSKFNEDLKYETLRQSRRYKDTGACYILSSFFAPGEETRV